MARKFLTGIDNNAQRLQNIADGTAATDAVSLQQLQAVARGIDWKDSVKAASTANVTVASALINGASMDGVTLATGDRVLLKNQTTGSENGIYVVAASGAASRSVDADSSAEVTPGMSVTVEQGTANQDKVYQLTTDGPITLGTTSLTFSPLGGSGVTQAYQTVQAAGSGLTQRSILNASTGLTAADNAGSTRTDLSIDTSVVVRKYAVSVGNGSLTSITVNHNLGTRDVQVQVYDNSTFETVECDTVRTDTNNVTLTFASAPASNAYRCCVQG